MVITKIQDATVLVVGGAGFIGSNLVKMILEREPREIIVVDNLLSSEPCNISSDPRVRFIFGSITDDNILSLLPENLDFVFHLACFHGNQSSIADPLADHANNALTSLKLFNRLKEIQGIRKIVYAGAACSVADKTFETPKPTTEDQPISLYHDSPYSISKIIGELYANYYFMQLQLPIVKARFSNVYGPREILGAGQWRGTIHTVWRNVIPTFIWRALNEQALQLDNSGQTSRDFIFVEDMVRGLLACALEGKAGEVYNLATGKETNIMELAQFINEYTGNETPLQLCPARDWDRSGKRFASTQKAETELDFIAQMNIWEGLRRTVEWTRINFELIKDSIAKHDKMMSQVGD